MNTEYNNQWNELPSSILVHNLKLIKRYLRLIVLSVLEFRVSIISEIVSVFSNLFLWLVFWNVILFQSNGSFGNWGSTELLIWYGFTEIGFAFSRLFFNIWQLDIYVIDVGLEPIITKPTNILSYVLFNSASINGIFGFFIGLISLFLGISQLDIASYSIFVITLILTFIICLLAVLNLAFIYCTLASLTFFLGDINFLSRLFGEVSVNFSRVPTNIYPKTIFNFLSYVLPIGLISTIPSLLLLNQFIIFGSQVTTGLLIVSILLIITVLWGYIAVLFFNYSLKNGYEGVGE